MILLKSNFLGYINCSKNNLWNNFEPPIKFVLYDYNFFPQFPIDLFLVTESFDSLIYSMFIFFLFFSFFSFFVICGQQKSSSIFLPFFVSHFLVKFFFVVVFCFLFVLFCFVAKCQRFGCHLEKSDTSFLFSVFSINWIYK